MFLMPSLGSSVSACLKCHVNYNWKIIGEESGAINVSTKRMTSKALAGDAENPKGLFS